MNISCRKLSNKLTRNYTNYIQSSKIECKAKQAQQQSYVYRIFKRIWTEKGLKMKMEKGLFSIGEALLPFSH